MANLIGHNLCVFVLFVSALTGKDGSFLMACPVFVESTRRRPGSQPLEEH